MTDLWGGRFAGRLDEAMRHFSSSLPVDVRLARQDLQGSRAHAHALLDAGVLDETEHAALTAALDQVEEELAGGRFPPDLAAPDVPEDIHSAVEARLVEICGDTARRLHAGRSRNDQVVTDTLLWLREASTEVEEAVRALQRALVDRAAAHMDLIIPAYTHLQRAQPVLLAHHLLAHVEALERDAGRLADARARANRCPLGAGACAGTTLPLDRRATAARLGFARVAANSLDAVSDRDWAVEFTAACALLMAHLSRLAGELVLWSSAEFAMVRLDDAFCTGSSMLPQKRNPDIAELVRGRAAGVAGDLVGLLTLLHGLPLSYNRDLQEDKAPLFRAVDTARDCARLLAAALAGADFRAPRMAGPDFSAAADLAEELVRRGVPFRTAHQRIGALVAACEAEGRGLPEATAAELEAAGLSGLDRGLLTARGSVRAKRTEGSTHPDQVAEALAAARRRLDEAGGGA